MTAVDSYDLETWTGFRDRLYAQGEFDIDFGLDAFREALERWDHPERDHEVILVGGTNGKGGVASAISAILESHGLQTGLFTSPHLLSLRERFRVGGSLVGRRPVLEVGRRALKQFGDSGGEHPQLSFFELCCLIATEVFRRSNIDVGVYEVGLGGRLDATNTLQPATSVISRVGVDHQRFLGDSVEDIVPEITGILRPECPAVVGQQSNRQITERISEAAPAETHLEWVAEHPRPEMLQSAAIGEPPSFKQENQTTAWYGVQAFLGDTKLSEFDADSAVRGLARHRWPGRFDRREVGDKCFNDLPGSATQPTVLLDAAHNPQAVDRLVEEIDDQSIEVGAIVFGGMTDKDLAPMVESLRRALSQNGRLYGATIDSPRAADRSTLTDAGCEYIAPTPEALRSALRHCATRTHRDSEVLVTGSIYLLGEVLELLRVSPEELATYVTPSRSV